MKKLTLFLIMLIFGYSRLFATDYYVTTTGNDGNNGSAGSPWRTISKACISVPANAGHKINIGAGLFTEINYLIVPAGVSIVGAGSGATTIKVNKYYDVEQNLNTCDGGYVAWAPAIDKFCMQITSGANQTIKGFKMDGQARTCHGAIYMDAGSNVIFDDLNIQNFKFTGLWLYTSTNCEIKNSYFQDNCFGTANQDAGNIMFHANTNLLIHDNTILETGVMGGKGGYGIKTYSKLFVNACFWQTWDQNWNAIANGTKIYNNTITVPELGTWMAGTNSVPDITIEFNGLSARNCKIYNNTLNNHISLIGVRGTGYDFQSFDVYNNYFNLGSGYRYACEVDAQGMEFRYNYIFGGYYPLAQWGNNSTVYNLKVHHNVFDSPRGGQPVVLTDNKIFQDFKFYNNTIIDVNGVSQIFRSGTGSFSNADVRNNIFMAPVARTDYFSSGTLTGTIAYNGFQNIPAKGTNAISGDMRLTLTGNKPAPFATLQSSSPVINNGVIISGITDGYIGSPERGAFEFGATPWTAGANAVSNPNPVGVTIPAKIQAENYNSMNGIVVEATTDVGGGSNIGYVDNNDWVDYLINVPSAGTYTVDLRVASQVAGSQLQIKSGATTLASVTVPNTGGWQTYQTVSTNIALSAGTQTIRLFCSVQNWNLNWVEFKAPIASNYEAETGTFSGGSQIQTASNASNGHVIGNMNNVGSNNQITSVGGGTGGTASLVIRYANGFNATSLTSLYVNGVDVAQISFVPTGSWNTFSTVTQTITLNTGTINTIKLQKDASDFSAADIDRYSVTPNAGSSSSRTSTIQFKENDDKSEVSLHVYPMPTSGDFTIELNGFSNPELLIADILGKIVFTKKEIVETKLHVKNTFGKGTFIVFVQDQLNKQSKKIIIE